MTASKIALIVVGVLTALIALGFLLGGGALVWAYAFERDDDGYVMTRHEQLGTTGYALVSEELDVDAKTPDWLLEQGDVRISAEPSDRATFLGIARREDVDRYLTSVPYTRVVDLEVDPFRWETIDEEGDSEPPGPPGDQDFWAASAAGTGQVDLDWEVETGDWVAVVMNDDAARGVDASLAAGANVPLFVLLLGIGLLVVGLLLGFAAFFFFRLSAQRAPPPATTAP